MVSKIIGAIGPKRAHGLVRDMRRLVEQTIGKPPLPDCPICHGEGLMPEANYTLHTQCGVKLGDPRPMRFPCSCTQR
jgi:hypothetical protein